MLLVAVLRVPVDDAELAADRMWMAGAQAVEERSVSDANTAGDREVEIVSALGDDADVATDRLGDLPDGWTLRFDEVDPTPAETWREFATPVVVAPDVVLWPAWLTSDAARAAVAVQTTVEPAIEVVIEPAGSFGLGDHPTTRLCAAAMRQLVSGGEAVLDVGSGSGVLGILALLCGAASVTATDISDIAVAATLDNARRNGVDDRVAASTASIDQIDGVFDVVVANILAPTLRAMSDRLRERLAPAGRLVLSGLLADHADEVVDAFKPLVVVDVARLDGWAAITMRHP